MKQRIITAAILIAVFLPIAILGGVPFLILTYAMATIGLYELFQMRKLKIASFHGIIALILLWIFLLPSRYFEIINITGMSKIELAFAAVLLFLSYIVIMKNQFTFDDAGFMILSILYVGIGFYYFVQTREAGLVYLFYALFVVSVTDSGAYFIGRKFGKRKLWPT